MKYEDLEQYYDEYEPVMTEILKKIEMNIVLARDTQKAPVYMTRARVKNIESSYLKSKRKDKKDILSITDLIGLRILCLFEEDIFGVYKFILEMCKSDVYILDEILIFGWKKESVLKIIAFEKELKKHKKYETIIFRDEPKENGYQSIHFVGRYKDFEKDTTYPFEIQVRTLLQDVWGELEHKLAYKQKQHPFIKNSFIRLSKSLETNDMLITHLKNIIDESSCGIYEIPFSIGNILKYEIVRLPKAFIEEGNIKKKYAEYTNIIYGNDFLRANKATEANKIYRELTTLYYQENPDSHDDYSFNYWKEMEKALFDIFDKKFDDAKRTYEKYLNEGSYVSAYRLGQIYLYEKKSVEALKKFDICFTMLDDKCLHVNRMSLHVNMALIFWNLGSDYLGATINAISQAIESTKINFSDYNQRDLETLYNSACWYYMECYFDERCNKKEGNANEKSKEYYEKLLKLIINLDKNNEVARKHTYDTLAWYNYQRYIESNRENISFIEEAYKYVMLMNKGIMPVAQYYSHEAIQQSHLQKIHCEYKKNCNN